MAKYEQLASKVNLNDALTKRLMTNAGIFDKDENWYTKFNRFPSLDPYNVFTTTKEYLFFTKPDLHIFGSTRDTTILNTELSNQPLFVNAMTMYREVLESLQLSVNPSVPFVALLSNAATSTMDMPSISTNEIETSENIYGTHMTYRVSSLTADEQDDFSIEFEDTRYLELYMWFRLYDEYCKLKDLGMVTPVYDDYILYKILEDQMAVWKIIVGEDGETIVYYAKKWGVFPKVVPREAFSDTTNLNGGLRFTINFKAQFIDDMDPTILADLNAITIPNGPPPASNIVKMYDKDIGSTNWEWGKLPFVIRDTTASRVRYKLKWTK